MQSENAATIVNLLQASYPQEAYKLNDDKDKKIFKGTQYSLLLYDVFGKVPDDLIMQAVYLAIKSYPKLPSVGQLATCVDQCRPSPHYPELPQSRHKIDMALIDKAFKLALDKKYQIPISDKLRDFAKEYFPDISDELIRQNCPELLNNMHNGMKIDGHPVVMKMDKETGYINTQICIPAFAWHRTNGVPDSFNKVFGESA
ncbi:hypothetical protein [Pectinatus frisingensis]|uniref:hypothetical protein n=1 Tax=Pectinatus frisingensis TaxID=865 RepID=UPI0018C59D72|nr:hypothetical protein [Pectinatus frisingensis]